LIPTDRNFQILDLFIGGNGIAEYRGPSELQLPTDVDWRKGVRINGRAPVWRFAFCVHRCHPAAWVAVMDPRHGAIVVESHDAAVPAAGTLIPLEDFQNFLQKHERQQAPPGPAPADQARCIAFVGPPHSGKSVLLRCLYRVLQARVPIERFQRDIFLIRACPGGEGNFFGEIPLDRALMLRNKAVWDQDFVEQICGPLKGVAKNKRLVLVDVGGKIDRRNHQILSHCTHAVIVSRDTSAIPEWRGALRASDTELIAEIESALGAVCEAAGSNPLRLRLGPLDRERPIESLPEEFIATVLPGE